MTPEEQARLYEDELPLDLSIAKIERIETQHEDTEVSRIESNCQNNFFPLPIVSVSPDIPECLLAIECQLAANIEFGIHFAPPIEYIYNPIDYAFQVHSNYVHKYCRTKKKLLFLGMNPGPWGMSQTGVPFGEIDVVKNWLQLEGFVGKPSREHPLRKVTGFDCRRSEISGKRFWSLFNSLCGTPENFFHHSFLHNYCPIALMDNAGRNITPAELKGREQESLQFLCDAALIAVIKLLGIDIVVGIGRFTEKRARAAIASAGLSTDIYYIPHPSPRSPSNVNWVETTAAKLQELNLIRFFSTELNLTNISGYP